MTALPQLKSMTCEIAVSGVAATLDLSGAMYCPDHDALVVADLHFEKGSSFARRGQLLPPYDTRETMGPLALAIERYRPATVIALGDSFHDLDGPERLVADDRAALARLQHGRRLDLDHRQPRPGAAALDRRRGRRGAGARRSRAAP